MTFYLVIQGQVKRPLFHGFNFIPYTHNAYLTDGLQEKFLKFGIKKFKPQESIISGCLHSSPPILESVSPMHSAVHRTKLWKKARKNPLVFPLDDIQHYYGI